MHFSKISNVQGNERLFSRLCPLGSDSGCPKEKGAGFIQGRLCLAFLFDFSVEGTGLMDLGRAVVVLPGRQKGYQHHSPQYSCILVRILWSAWVDKNMGTKSAGQLGSEERSQCVPRGL